MELGLPRVVDSSVPLPQSLLFQMRVATYPGPLRLAIRQTGLVFTGSFWDLPAILPLNKASKPSELFAKSPRPHAALTVALLCTRYDITP